MDTILTATPSGSRWVYRTLTKKERIKRRIYSAREEARSDIFDYIEVFYNRRRRHSHLGQLSPADYEEKERLNEAAECL